jgi:hypothetical protein
MRRESWCGKPQHASINPGPVQVRVPDLTLLSSDLVFDFLQLSYAAAANPMPMSRTGEDATDPKMPPCALTIFRPISWNSGK